LDEAAPPLPLVLQPRADILFVPWMAYNRDWVERAVVAHGALLFRNFHVRNARQFSDLAEALMPERMNYVEGSSPRLALGDSVYTSTEYPSTYHIPQHNELSYARTWPGTLMFFCDQAPLHGGETPLADGRRVLERMDPDVVERFRRHGVRYTRNLHDGEGPGLSWRTVFETDDREAVEAHCFHADIEFRWRHDGGLWTSQVRPAVVRHPATGEEVWFSQADHWHPAALGAELSTDVSALFDDHDLPTNASYGDGAPITVRDLAEVQATLRAASVRFSWRAGDVLVVDNTLVSHGRMPFTGDRRVLVAMGAPVSAPACDATEPRTEEATP
jgi:alpha-ketoglutarate-dependent taurine dioxygenase